MQSRYYNPEIGRFINADNYPTTGQGLTGNNMFAYCGNNPIVRVDRSGRAWSTVRSFFTKALKNIGNWAKKTFGAGYTTTTVVNHTKINVIPNNFLISAETGTITTETIVNKGNSSKPISVYADTVLDYDTSSSAGINFNFSKTTINMNLAADDIGVSVIRERNTSIDSYALRCNLSEFEIGFERANSVQWDSITHTSYTNVSVSGWLILAAYYFATTGQVLESPQTAYT